MARHRRSAEGDPEGLGKRAVRGVAVTLAGQWGRTVVQLGSTFVLARLLTPSDFGLVAAVLAVGGVADLLRDFGLSGAVVQAREIGPRLQGALMWLSLWFGLATWVVFSAAAPLVAGLYNEPRLTAIVLVVAPMLLVNSLSMPLQTFLQRSLEFGTLARVDVTCMISGVVVGIAVALAGGGYWAPVAMALAQAVSRYVSFCRALPIAWGRPVWDAGMRGILTSGRDILGVQVLNYAARNADNVFVGRYAGAGALGLYSRAYSLMLLPLSQINGPLARVALPVLSGLYDEPERFRRYVRQSMTVLAYAAIPSFAVAAAVADPLVRMLLGDQWRESATIFQWLALAGVAQALGNAQGWFYVSLHRTRAQLRYNLLTRPVVIASFPVGLWLDGVNGLAAAYAVTSLLLLLPGFANAVRGTFVQVEDIWRPSLAPVLLSVPALLLARAAVAGTTGAVVPLQLVAGCLAGLVPFVLGAVLVPPVRQQMTGMAALLRQVAGRAQPAPGAESPGTPAVDGEHVRA